jgi:hypothetical protein
MKREHHFLLLTLTKLTGDTRLWKHSLLTMVEVCIEEYVAVGEIDDGSDDDNNDGNDDENLEVELLVSLRETVKLLDRLIHVDGMSEDDTDS